MYLGMFDQLYTLPMFDAQAWFCRDTILGHIPLPSDSERKADINKWINRLNSMENSIPNRLEY
jgi:trimethylamine monooxygenase